jgi:DNA repair protein RadC
LNRTAVEPRAILKEALLRSAASMILFHTHTSGDPSPSMEDLEFTRRMLEAGKLLNIRLLDHLILGAHGRWVSLARRGAF